MRYTGWCHSHRSLPLHGQPQFYSGCWLVSKKRFDVQTPGKQILCPYECKNDAPRKWRLPQTHHLVLEDLSHQRQSVAASVANGVTSVICQVVTCRTCVLTIFKLLWKGSRNVARHKKEFGNRAQLQLFWWRVSLVYFEAVLLECVMNIPLDVCSLVVCVVGICFQRGFRSTEKNLSKWKVERTHSMQKKTCLPDIWTKSFCVSFLDSIYYITNHSHSHYFILQTSLNTFRCWPQVWSWLAGSWINFSSLMGLPRT